MTAKGHLFLALLPAEMIGLNLTGGAQSLFLFGAALGSLLPDIDEPRSYIGMKFPYLSIPLKLFGIKHRTITHSIWFILLFLIPGLMLNNFFLLGLSLGVFMHLIGDMLTKGGVPLFYPLTKHYRLLPKEIAFYTNSFTEHILVGILALLNGALFFAYLQGSGLLNV